ncbi:glycosyltransferase family 39 protein [Methanobrevibacter sp.]|uniref:glycosyltransferase family 39 protein n=1 Tax=Methanobrevibacter sp. TaxID=66852 RepID=UPI00388F9522
MFLKDFNLNKKDVYFLIITLIISLVLTGYYILFNANLGIYCSDVYVYLLNAVYFNGTNINSANTIYLSPIICYLTSLLFRLGLNDKIAIFIVTGIFAIVGNIGLYLLLKTRFDEILSLCGVILYSTFAINLTWLANGTLDIPAVSITILIVLLSIVAINKNPKYYVLLVPMLVIGIFTRYTVILILPVLALYYIYYKGFTVDKKDLKYILIGIILGIAILAIIYIKIDHMSFGNIGVNSQISGGVSGDKGSTIDQAYNTDTFYYLTNFINFISSSSVSLATKTPVLENPTINSFIIIAILAIGSILFIERNDFKLKENLLPIAIFIISLVTFNHISSFITIILTFIGLFLVGRNSENKTGIVMLGWILAYLIFFSYYNIKVNRYIIPAIPPLVYLILSGIELINEKTNINRNIIPIALIILFLIQGFTFCFAFEDTQDYKAIEDMSDYIKSEVPDYSNQTIGVYNMRLYHWYLGKNVTGIESNNQTKIEEANITYYISNIPQDNLTNFKEIKNIENLYLYEKSV